MQTNELEKKLEINKLINNKSGTQLRPTGIITPEMQRWQIWKT